MPPKKTEIRIWALPFLLAVTHCVNDGGTGPGGGGSKNLFGNFVVSLKEETPLSPAFTFIKGQVNDGPTPSLLAWQELEKSGVCRVLKPMAPFCDPACGPSARCVEGGICQPNPSSLGVGKVSVQGMKTNSGPASISMDPTLNFYQHTGSSLAYPPFAEGDAVILSAAGSAAASAFILTARGIAPLVLLTDSVTLADGRPVSLRWTPPASPGNSTISVVVDISGHGGRFGVIECEAEDNGELEIAAVLVDRLKAMGVAGYPEIMLTRESKGSRPDIQVNLVLESSIVRLVHIPGLVSCNIDEDCPTGQTCGTDLRCQ